MKKSNNYIGLGIFLNGLWLLSNQFDMFPDFIEGLCVGVGITFILIGMYKENHNINKFKDYKKRLFTKAFGK